MDIEHPTAGIKMEIQNQTTNQGNHSTENVSTVMPFEKPKNKQFTAGHIATDTSNRHLHYGIVIDCGSSGSRVYVYFWPPHDGNPKELLNIQQMRDANSQLVVMKVEPGKALFSYYCPLTTQTTQHTSKSSNFC